MSIGEKLSQAGHHPYKYTIAPRFAFKMTFLGAIVYLVRYDAAYDDPFWHF